MACFHPLTAYRTASGDVVFSELKRFNVTETLTLPCGQCTGCRLERSRQWAMRCIHEASLHRQNCFITLTYSDENVPPNASLRYEDYQLFMKRLRKHFKGRKIRFYMGGEYGEQLGRPHYHACLFGVDFDDRSHWSTNPSGDRLDRSALLDRLWGKGHCSVGNITFESAAYIARYIMKKVTGDLAASHYGDRVPEFNHMSLKPGIGFKWLQKFQSDVYPHDYVVVNAQEVKPPKYYDKKFSKADPLAFEEIQFQRQTQARAKYQDNTPERLAVREQVLKAKLSPLKRTLS